MNLTFPIGVPLPLVTVAVKLTDCPKVDGFGDALTVVVVAGLLTVRSAEPLLPEWTAVAEKVAVIVCGLAEFGVIVT